MANFLNIGLIGSGFMGQAHADAYRRAGILYRNLPRTPVLYAIADQNDTLAEQARSRLGFAKGYGDWRRLVEDPQVDVVDITTPNHLHVEPALAALEAGKQVYCEKPMAVKVQDAQRMAAAARKAGVKTLGYFDMKVFEVHDLLQAIGRDEPSFPDFEFGARNQEILEAMGQSSNSGTWVWTKT